MKEVIKVDKELLDEILTENKILKAEQKMKTNSLEGFEKLRQENLQLKKALELACDQITKLNFIYDEEKSIEYSNQVYDYFYLLAKESMK